MTAQAWTDADMAEVDADARNLRTCDPMYCIHDASRPAEHVYDDTKSSGSVKPATAAQLAEAGARMRRELPLERARLAEADRAGEAAAIAPLSAFRAHQVLVEAEAATAKAAETRAARQRRRPTFGAEHRESGRDLLTRLGADPSRIRGVLRCPAHEDRSPSLSFALAPDGRALLRCFAGCTFAEILAAIG